MKAMELSAAQWISPALACTCFVLMSTLAILPPANAQYPSSPQIQKDGMAVVLEDCASLPLSSPTRWGGGSEINYKNQLGRVTSLRSEPADAPLAKSRYFVVDQSNTIYILDRESKKFTPFLRFNEIFPKFVSDTGAISVGLVSLAFDPEYAKNGKFYTVHTEEPTIKGSAVPVSDKQKGLNVEGYQLTPAVTPDVGTFNLESVLVEWTDRDIHDSSFEGTARELLRVSYYRSHPMADLTFNPLARSGDPDYGNLYVGIGDGATGETDGPVHVLPQRLDSMLGKVLRITPDVTLRPKDMLAANGRYRIPSTGPDPNPFIAVAKAHPEIFAYGLRNPHRLYWDEPTNTVLMNDIGTHSWEEVNLLRKGANYGHAEREGNDQFFVKQGKTGGELIPPAAFPKRDLLSVEGLDEPIVPIYPAATYSHRDGDAIGAGLVYRGKLLPALRGKYIFSDLTTGRIFYSDLKELLATGGKRNKTAQIHEIQILYKGEDSSAPTERRMFDIVAETFAKKGGQGSPPLRVLPGGASATTGYEDREHGVLKTDPEGVPWGGGRADVRVVADGDGELFVLSKSDGMIRRIVSATAPSNLAGR